jgi:hypothetical protein
MSRFLQGTDGRTRLLFAVPAVIVLFALGWWALGALGFIEAGSSEPDGGVVIEPPRAGDAIAAGTPTPRPTVEPPSPTAESEPTAPSDEPAVTIEPTDAPATATAAPPPAPGATQPAPPPPPPPPPPTGSLAGVRVWSNGDSTSFFMSVAFLNMAAAMGAVPTQPAPEYKISSGLWRPEYFDWPAYLASEMASLDPDVVVFMVGANDAYVGLPLDTYRQRVAAVMDQLSDRRVIWVGQPNMGRADLAASIPPMNDVYRSEASARGWVTYVDAWSLTSDASGAYTAYLPDENGNLVLARGEDGVHFTSAGGAVLGRAVLRAVLGG